MTYNWVFMFWVFLLFLIAISSSALGEPALIDLTLVRGADTIGAVCLDGSLPGYHLDPGSGNGAKNWIVHLQGGAWCATTSSCAERSTTSLGSSRFMGPSTFLGILSNSPSENPYFYNWNRVKVRYCDGGSFSGDVDLPAEARVPGSTQMQRLYYRGQRIWEAVIAELLRKGMAYATKAILSGESAGGLASLIHCNDFRDRLPGRVDARCVSDGGIFLDILDFKGSQFVQPYFKQVVELQNIGKNLPKGCTSERDPSQCFFPQYFLDDIYTPTFILESAYDTYQLRNYLVPPSEDPQGVWVSCTNDPNHCSAEKINIIQDFRKKMVNAVSSARIFDDWGVFLISCYYHTQSQNDDKWNGPSNVDGMNPMKAVGKWAYSGVGGKYIDNPYPSNPSCR